MASLRLRVAPLLRLHNLARRNYGFPAFYRGARERMAYAPELHTGRIVTGWQQARAKHISRVCRGRKSGAPRIEGRAADLSPGVLRLNLGASLEDKLMELGQAQGPLAVYDHLVGSGPGEAGTKALQGDVAQRRAMEVLQQVWKGAHKYMEDERKYFNEVLPAWEVQVERQRAEFEAKLKAELEAKIKSEKDVAGDEEGEAEKGQATKEFVPPPAPLPPCPSPGGLFLHGQVGVGKSMLVDLFFDFCTAGVVGPTGARRVHFHEFLHELHVKLAKARGQTERDTGAIARSLRTDGLRLLCLDEFQITNISDALVLETFLSELCRRCGVIVLFTSNRPPEELYKDGVNKHLAIPQFLDLLRDIDVLVHSISTQNFRDLRVTKSSTSGSIEDQWAVGLDGTASDKHLADAFRRITGVERGKTASVPITWGRKHHVEEHHNGVARFRFEELCGVPLSSDDYLALAHHFHTFIVSGIPCFKVSQHNEARRFTNLVDVLYEQNSRLVCSAEEEPEKLLEAMEGLLNVGLGDLAKNAQPSIGGADSWKPGEAGNKEPRIAWEGNPWRRNDPFAKDFNLEDAINLAKQGKGLSSSTGDDASGNMVGVAGVLAPAVASLQESGFASRRAVSRMRHMRSDEYREVHKRRYLQ